VNKVLATADANLAYCLSLFAFREGGKPEKAVASIYVIAFIFGILNRIFRGGAAFLELEPMFLGIEFGVLVGLTFVAIRANRWWPLCASALQLIVITTHTAKAIGIQGLPGVYWGMTTIPTYLQFGVLLLGIAAHFRRVRRIGLYPDWRTP
jgi:hypothetical protein